MPKRKATKAELEYGIGEAEVEENGIEPEIDSNELMSGFAADEENDIDDEVLIKEYEEQLKAYEEGED